MIAAAALRVALLALCLAAAAIGAHAQPMRSTMVYDPIGDFAGANP